MPRTTEQWIEEYNRLGALFIHDNNPQRPHALLTSGKHSSGFFNGGIVMEHPLLLAKAVEHLIDEHSQLGGIFAQIDRVIGPAMGGITIAHEFGKQISQQRGWPCLCGYAEKVSATDKTMVLKRTTITPGERILLVEDTITTSGSVQRTAEAIQKAGGIVFPVVAALVNRSGLTNVNGWRIISVIEKPLPIWDPEDCPLCKQGSQALHPKTNWELLNQKY